MRMTYRKTGWDAPDVGYEEVETRTLSNESSTVEDGESVTMPITNADIEILRQVVRNGRPRCIAFVPHYLALFIFVSSLTAGGCVTAYGYYKDNNDHVDIVPSILICVVILPFIGLFLRLGCVSFPRQIGLTYSNEAELKLDFFLDHIYAAGNKINSDEEDQVAMAVGGTEVLACFARDGHFCRMYGFYNRTAWRLAYYLDDSNEERSFEDIIIEIQEGNRDRSPIYLCCIPPFEICRERKWQRDVDQLSLKFFRIVSDKNIVIEDDDFSIENNVELATVVASQREASPGLENSAETEIDMDFEMV